VNWFIIASFSAVLSAAAAISQKKVLLQLNAFEFSFLSSGAIILFSLFVPFFYNVTPFHSSTLLIIVGKSILGGIAFLFVMMSLERNPISTALPVLGLTPAITALVSMVMIGEGLDGWEWLGIVLMMTGVYILEIRPAQHVLQPFKEILRSKSYYYLYAALGLFAMSSVYDKLLVGKYQTDPWVVLFYQHIIYFILFTTFLFFRKSPILKVVHSGKKHILLIILIALLTIAYRFTQLEATKLAPVALVLAVKRTSILYASFFGGKFFSDERLLQKIVGAACIVGAGFLILRNVN
jgi:drug/metabolite transporter (DMT)-like permease